jgi:hypothetical protein
MVGEGGLVCFYMPARFFSRQIPPQRGINRGENRSKK